jgi:hypothetical protein
VLCVVALLATGAWQGFRYVKLHLALRRAQHEFANRQFMRADFWTNRAFSVDAKNVEATRLMAEIAEAQDKPTALGWRIRLVQREPGNNTDILAWAKCAFRFGQREMAVNALKSLPADFQDRSADCQQLLAGCALGNHEPGLAEVRFVRAAELDRDNPVHRVNLAAFRLTDSPNRETREAAARELEAALGDPKASLFAARALLTEAIRTRNHAKALVYADKLRAIPGHGFGDDVRCLETAIGEARFRTDLEALEHRAEADAQWTVDVGEWLNAHGMADEMLRWFDRLPKTIQATVRVQMTVAESYLAKADWKRLQTYLADRRWDDGEFLKRAILVRCHRELGEPWEKEWNQLAAECGANAPDGLLLAQLVMSWQWRQEAIELLWTAASHPETNALALQNLWKLYAQKNETRELLRVAKAQMALDDSNPTTKNNEAFLALLLYGPSARAERLAREASTANPKVPEWAATYAFALHLAGKDAEAKKVMENLSADAVQHPGIALYYAIVLAGNGDADKAREFMAKLNPQGMLPEEQKLAVELAQQLKKGVVVSGK